MASDKPATPGRRSRGIGLTHAAVVLAIVVLAGSVALATPAPSPPTVAELAPPERAPTASAETATPTPTAEGSKNPYDSIDRSRVRRCVGNPPRQTEDPMSPPCIAYWDGKDNGGATSKGVTKTQINIVMPGGIGFLVKGTAGLIDYFNTRYEFYGRKLNLQYLPTGEWLELLNPSQYASYAEQIDSEMDAFAVLSPSDVAMGSATTLYDMLAERGIISIDVGAGFRTEEELNDPDLSNYKWSFNMTDDVLQQNVAEWACKNLVGKPAVHGGEEYVDTTRRFGIVVQRNSAGLSMDASVLEATLDSCDADVVGPEELTYTYGADPEVPDAKTVLAKLRSQDATSVMCVCGNHFIGQAMIASEELGWSPEWVSTGTGRQAADTNLAYYWPPEQLAHFFGPDPGEKVNAYPNEPWFQAAQEADPSIVAGLRQQESNWGMTLEQMYNSLLILASGIQGAGPDLTPETFAAALESTKFPNPGAGGPPYYQPRVGFGVGDHSFVDDAQLVYWDPTVRPYDDPQLGAFCYLDHGKRYRLGGWPANTDLKFYPGRRPTDVPCR